MRPSSISFVRVSFATSRRMPSNDESTTACGVSSMITSTPVRCSSARILRPSRPMMRPFMSSEGSSISETVVSEAWLAATRWRASATRLRARRFASARASSSACRTRRASSWRTSSSDRSSMCALASLTVIPEMRSSSVICESRASLRSSWSCLVCTSRSNTPCSRRVSSVSFSSMSSSFASTRSSILRISVRRSPTSCSISARSRTEASRASICPSRRSASASLCASRRITSVSRLASLMSSWRVRRAAARREPAKA